MSTTLTGARAELRVGYQVAAAMDRYKLVRERADVYEFEGDISSRDEFWLERGPLELHVFVGTRPWRWRGITPRIEANKVSVSISGEPER